MKLTHCENELTALIVNKRELNIIKICLAHAPDLRPMNPSFGNQGREMSDLIKTQTEEIQEKKRGEKG